MDGSVLDEVWRRGRLAWPKVFVDRAAAEPLAAAAGPLAAAAEPLAAAAGRASDLARAEDVYLAHAEDVYLALGCALGVPAALAVFDELVLATAATAIRRYGADPAEVLQRVRIHLLVAEDGAPPRIARYDGRASLRAWIATCAVRMALYLLRGQRNAKEVAVDWPDVIADLPTDAAELDSVRARYADAFRGAWRAACEQLSPRHRAILRMAFVEGVSLDRIAATYAVHRTTVWRWLEEAKTRVLVETRVQLAEVLAASDPGTASLLELVGSQLELGLSVLS